VRMNGNKVLTTDRRNYVIDSSPEPSGQKPIGDSSAEDQK